MRRGGPLKRTSLLRRGGPLPQRRKRRPGAPPPEFSETYGKDKVHTRSSGVCELCGQARAAHWHHRLNKGQGGLWDPANGYHLCPPCHTRVTASDEELFTNGWRIRRRDKRPPQKVPVLHWQWGFVCLDSLGGIHRRSEHS